MEGEVIKISADHYHAIFIQQIPEKEDELINSLQTLGKEALTSQAVTLTTKTAINEAFAADEQEDDEIFDKLEKRYLNQGSI